MKNITAVECLAIMCAWAAGPCYGGFAAMAIEFGAREGRPLLIVAIVLSVISAALFAVHYFH